jgi:quercetin dioxygenase-like cupin family protein
MRLSLHDHPDGVETGPGARVVYEIARNEARFGAARVDGHALRWELGDGGQGAILSMEIELDPSAEWILRCDRIDFPPGSVAPLHTHPGPGIRCLLFGSIRVDTDGRSVEHGPLGAWFESGQAPVHAAASETEPSAFVRVMLLPREWEGKRTIRYLDPDDAGRPKQQRATVFFDRPVSP